MALVDQTAAYDGTSTALAQPTTSETITTPDEHTILAVTVGGTATTITIVRPGTDAVGVAIPDQTLTGITNATKFIKVDRNYRDPTTGNATVTFSQVTGVTASVLRSN